MRAQYLPVDPELYICDDREACGELARSTAVGEEDSVNAGMRLRNPQLNFHHPAALPLRGDKNIHKRRIKTTPRIKIQTQATERNTQPSVR